MEYPLDAEDDVMRPRPDRVPEAALRQEAADAMLARQMERGEAVLFGQAGGAPFDAREDELERLQMQRRMRGELPRMRRRGPAAGAGGMGMDEGETDSEDEAYIAEIERQDRLMHDEPPPLPPLPPLRAAAPAAAPPGAAAAAAGAAGAEGGAGAAGADVAAEGDWIAENAKDCPSCFTPCELQAGCQHVTCSGCSA
jgi:hypothetical protein